MKSIGFIGTGLMGFPMAIKLLKSGFSFRMVALIIYAMSAIFSFTAFLIYNLIAVLLVFLT